MNCEALQRILLERQRELTESEAAHLSTCDDCMDTLLTVSLETKPDVGVPADFAARVAAALPSNPPLRPRRPRHAGLATAMVFVAALLVVWFTALRPQDGLIQLVFMLLVVTEIAGLALWLAPRQQG